MNNIKTDATKATITNQKSLYKISRKPHGNFDMCYIQGEGPFYFSNKTCSLFKFYKQKVDFQLKIAE